MAGPALDLKPPFSSVAEFLTWLRSTNPLNYSWNSLEPSPTKEKEEEQQQRFSTTAPFMASAKKDSSLRKDLRPIFSTRVKPNVTFSERQRLKKKGAPVLETNGLHFDSPALSRDSFSDRQKLRKRGTLSDRTTSELFDSVDHLFPGSSLECDTSSDDSMMSDINSLYSRGGRSIISTQPFHRSKSLAANEAELGFKDDEFASGKEKSFEHFESSEHYDSPVENGAVEPATRRRRFGIRLRLGNNGRRLLSGAIAGAFSRTAVAPLETIRTHMMVGTHGKSFNGVLEWIIENEGWTGLFRGNTINVLRVAPSKAIELFIYDKVKFALISKDGGTSRLKIPAASIAGSAAGISSTVLMYPLELLKTRLTIQPKEYHSISNAFRRIVKEEGFWELYRGLGPSVVGVIPYAGTNYFAYDYLRTLYKKIFKTDEIGNLQTLLIGSASGAIASSATFPLEVARKRMQVGAIRGKLVYKNTVDCLASILREEGLAGLYRGLGPSCLKLVPAAGLSFMCYEALKRVLLEEEERQKQQ
ncbi:hypothetical protein R1flu_020540 [Riccia fluitans]|uniref:Mitochondrial carrier protein n=1 Tax=Riccia fluitans TaxID=41844 RepID=A0ABD1ZLT5_9MARC